MNAHDRLVDYYHRLMGCTAEDAELLATHIMATLERRGNGRVYNCANKKGCPPLLSTVRALITR